MYNGIGADFVMKFISTECSQWKYTISLAFKEAAKGDHGSHYVN